MRKVVARGRAAAAFVLCLVPALALAVRPVTARSDAPRADASVLAALNRGDETLDVIVGIRDDDQPAQVPASANGPEDQARGRERRLRLQRNLTDAVGPGAMAVRRHYAAFSMLAARASRGGVLALANRPEVAWVTLDGERRAQASGPQPAQRLMHSDQANALGFDGAGQTIAVLDTGVDYTIADLGGGAFPNAKVVGGADLGDNDADPMDCEGHGTSVAAVAAGPAGVAPGARLVAVKISSTGRCDTADDSVILAGVDWVISHRESYGITAINLSFGGPLADDSSHGYCDDAFPQYAVAIQAANASGIVFVAAAGNNAFAHAIGVPACISTAVSAGAVYADAVPSVAWEDGAGGTLCEDQPVAPDTVACFSNSASNLSLLAPGAFWLAPTLGGAVAFFSGTSASAPAVAGAAAILRQARPDLSPAAVASLLAATGRAVSDPRNGVLTPRVDALAAVQLAGGAFASFEQGAVAIPDGAGSAAAAVTVAGFPGVVASVQAVVEIEHDDPRQLSVSLEGPDGTTVLLHDHTGAPGRPINGVYGKTLAAAQSLSAFQSKPPNGIWTLTVTDGTPLVAGRIRKFAIRLVAGQPAAAIPPAAANDVLPLVGHVQGTKLFLSDARLYNPRPEPQVVSLFYVAQGLAGSQAVQSRRTIGPGQVLALDDVVGSEFGYSNSIGALTLLGPETSLIVSSRAYTQGEHGTFGLFVPAAGSGGALGPGQTATANGLARSFGFHTNAGFAEVSGAPVSVKMEIFAGDGAPLGSTTRRAPANGNVLVTDLVAERGISMLANFRIDYTVTSATGRVIPYATLVDNATGDGLFETAALPAAQGDDLVIAQASHATGANGDAFRTDLYVTNLGASDAAVTISLIPRFLSGTPRAAPTHTLGPGRTLESLDVLASEFGLEDASAAGLRIHPSAGARLVVSTRTAVRKFGGTFGFAIPGAAVSGAIGAGDGVVTAIQLDHTSSARGSRANFGFAEVAGADAAVRVTAKAGDTGAVLGSRAYSLAAGTSFQAGVTDLVGSVAAPNFYLQFSVESGAGRILAYGVAIDNTSGDAIYVPAQREP